MSLRISVLGTVTYCSSSISSDGAISSAVIVGGTGPYTFSYSLNNVVVGTSASINSISTGQYVLTVRDSVSAVTTRTYTVDSNSDCAISFSGSNYVPVRNTLGCSVVNATPSFTTIALNTMYTGSLSVTNTRVNAIAITSLPVMINYCVEFWANSTQNTTTLCQITRHDLNSNSGLCISNNLMSFDGDSGGTEPAVLPAASFNTWNHYAYVGSPNYVAVFQNGFLLKRYPANSVALTSILQINNSVPSNNVFVGYIQDLVISNHSKYPTRCFVPTLLNGLTFNTGVVNSCARNGESTGSIVPAVMTSGVAPLTFAWSTINGTGSITTQNNTAKTGLPAGCYKCIVTSATGASQTIGYTILQPISVSTCFTSKAVSGNGSALISASGGFDLFESTWTNASTLALAPKIPLSIPLLTSGYGALTQRITTWAGCTMESWMFPLSAPANASIIELSATSANIAVLYTSGTISLQIGTVTTSFNTNVILGTLIWQHVAVTISSLGTAILYVNGVFAAQMNVSVPTNVSRAFNYGYNTATAIPFSGYLTSLRYWNAVRSAGSIFETLYRPLNGSEPGLVFAFGPASAVKVNVNLLTDVTGNFTMTVNNKFYSSDYSAPYGSIFGDLGNQALPAGTYNVSITSSTYQANAFPMVQGNRVATPTGIWLTNVDSIAILSEKQTGLRALESAPFSALRTPAFIVPALNFENSFTVEMWFKQNSAPDDKRLFQIGNFQFHGNNIYTNKNFLSMFTGSAGSFGAQILGAQSAPMAVLVQSAWTHIAMTYDASTNLLWAAFNGVAKSFTQSILPLPRNSVISLFNASLNSYYDNIRVTQSALYNTATYTVQSNPANVLFVEDFEIRLVVTATTVDCTALGSSDGSVSNLVISGGTGPYTVSGAFSSTAGLSALLAGRYTVLVKDSLLSFASVTFTVGQPVTVIATTSSSVNGLPVGSISLAITGGPVDTFSWTLAGKIVSQDRNVTSLVAGSYTCTILFGGVTTTVNAVVNNTVLTPGIVGNVTVFNGSDGSIGAQTITSVNVPVTFLWNTGATTAGLTGVTAGNYSCAISDSLGFISTLTYLIAQPIATTISSVPSTISALGSASIIAAGGNNTFAYVWTATGFNAPISTGTSVLNLPPGSYTCTVTSGSSTAAAATVVTGSAAPAYWLTGKSQFQTNDFSFTGRTCMDLTTATRAAYGSFPTYTIPAALFSKSFTIEFFMYNTSGSSSAPMIFINDNTSSIQLTGSTLSTSAGQSVAIGGATLNSWQHVAISYDAIAMKLFACMNGTLSSIVAATVVTLVQPSICFLWANNQVGSATPYTNGFFDSVRFSQACLYSGTTSYTVPNASLFAMTGSVLALDSFDNALVISKGTVTPPLITGQSTGTIGPTIVSGGTPPYSYVWQSFSSTAITAISPNAVSGLASGLYILQISDSAGAVSLIKYTIVDPLKITISTSNVTSNGVNDGSATATVLGGFASMNTSTLTFQWLDAYKNILSTALTASNLLAGTYIFNAYSNFYSQTLLQSSTVVITTSNVSTSTLLANLPCNGNIQLMGQTAQPTLVVPAGNAVSFVPGPFAESQGLNLNNSTSANFSSVTLPLIPALNFDFTTAFSFGGWFNDNNNLTASLSYAWMSNARASSTGLEFLRFNNASMRVNYGASTGTVFTNPSVAVLTSAQQMANTQNWNHLWITYTGPAPATNIIQIWRNGVLVASSIAVGSANFASTAGWTIANGQNAAASPLTISDIRWYSGFISPYTAMQPIIPLTVVLTPFPASSAAASDGAVTAVASGTGGTVTYLWSTGATSASIVNLSVGAYSCLVTDASGNQVTRRTFIVNPITLNLTKTDAVATGAVNNSTITSTAMQAVINATYTYAWSKDSFVCSTLVYTATSGTISVAMPNAFPGVYALTVTAFGSSTSATITVISGVATPSATCLVNLQMNGSLLDTGSIRMSPITTSLGSVAYVEGQTAGSKALQIPQNGFLTLPYFNSIDYNSTVPLAFGGWFNIRTFGLFAQLMTNDFNSAGLQVQLLFALTMAPTATVTAFGGNVNSFGAAYNSALPLRDYWNHFWICYTPVSSRMVVYMNGIAAAFGTVTNNFISSSSTWLIGSSKRSAGFFTGGVCNIQFYNQIIDPIKVMQSTAVPTTTLTINNVTVAGSSTGVASANVVAVAGRIYSFLWSSGETTSSISSKPAGTYTVSITDDTGLSVTRSVVITEPMGATFVSTPATLSSNGTITLTIIGGTGSVTVQWKNAFGTVIPTANPLMLTGVPAGTYTYVITSGGISVSGTAVVQSNLQFSNSPTSVLLTYNAVAGAFSYKIVYSVGTTNILQTFAIENFGLSALITGLLSNQLYNFQVFAKIAGIHSLQAVGSTTTPGNSLENYTKAALVSPIISRASLTYSIATLVTAAAAVNATQTVEAAVSSIFSTGDRIRSKAKIGLSVAPVIATVVTLNTSIPVLKNIAVYIPFDKAVTAVQTASLQLSNNTVVPVSFNAANSSITVNGVVYTVGQQFLLDGQVVTVTEN